MGFRKIPKPETKQKLKSCKKKKGWKLGLYRTGKAKKEKIRTIQDRPNWNKLVIGYRKSVLEETRKL